MTKQEQRDVEYEAYRDRAGREYEVYEAGREHAYELYRNRAEREQALEAELEKIQNEIKWVTVVVVGMLAVNFIISLVVN